MFKSAVILTSVLFASVASAQVSSCQANVNTPALIRAEGIAERISDLVVSCPAGLGSGTFNVVVDLSNLSPYNTDPTFVPTPAIVTSRLVAPSSHISEALLLIDEPSSATVGTNLFPGVQTAPSELTFYNVPSNGRTYRITNVRIDARDLPGTTVGAIVHLGQGLAGSTLAGIKAPGVHFALQDTAGNAAAIDLTQAALNAPLAGSSTATGGVLTHQLVFTEGFTQSFRKRNTATTVANPAALADQGVPGTDYHTESGFYLSALSTNGLTGAGLATQGTRLTAHFSNIPDGVALYVTTNPLPGTGGSSALLTGADASGNGVYTATPFTTTVTTSGGGVGIAPVILTAGSGTATWELLNANSDLLEQYTFGLVVAYAAPQTGTAVVTGGLGPISAVITADGNSPLPRFANLAADAAACTATPCLTGTPSAISVSYQIGAAVPSPINIQVSSSGSALAYNVAIGNGVGVLSLSAASGTTPSTVQLSITPMALAGMYQYSIVLSSPTAAFAPVTIPVILMVTTASSGTSALQCTVTNQMIPNLRNTGTSEFIGDVVLACSNGTATASGSTVPSYDVQLSLTTPMTSRSYSNGWSEAMLVIDEPGSGLAGSPASQLACGDPTGMCLLTGTGTGSGTYSGAAGRPNVFAGRISGDTITFPGVPVDPPSAGNTRILRITNVRTDVSNTGTSAASISGTVSVGALTVTNAITPVGYVTPGLLPTIRTADDSSASTGTIFATCPSASAQGAGVLRFSSLFGTAFRPRTSAGYVDAQTSPAPQAQNMPGSPLALSTESKFYAPALTSPVVDFASVGLATTGTRLRAQIDNLPAGTRIFVSTVPVVFSGGVPSVATAGAIARLVQNEMLPFLPLAPTTTLNGIPAAELTPIGGSASAAWEVLLSNTAALQNLDFLVWVQGIANSTSPATFTGSFSPAPGASSMLPRFAVSSGSGANLFTINGCPAITPGPDLVVTSVTGPTTGNPGETVSLSATVLNQGTLSGGPFRAEFYFSPSTNASLVTAVDTTGGCTIASLAPGASTTCSIAVAVPGAVTPGTWYLAALADSNAQVTELDETNNWRIADTGPVTMGTALCSLSLAPPTASLPATGTSSPSSCPDPAQTTCGFYPEAPLTIAVTPSGTCGAWTATSSNPGVVQVISGATGSGVGTVGITVLTNVHTTQRSATVTVSSGTASASYTLTQAGSADNLTYREVYALYEQLLGRDPDTTGFAFWTNLSTVGLGEMADDFLTSPEVFGNDFAVMAAYQAATGAPPTFAKFAPAVIQIRSGAQTVAGLFNSLIGSGYTAANLYQNLLNRQPTVSESSSATTAGLAPWFQALIGYPAGTAIALPSNEFQSTGAFHSDHSNALYVQMLYYVILSRDPDPNGLSFWTSIANTGGAGILFQGQAGVNTRLSILGLGTANEGFIGSPEFQGLFAN